MQVNLALTKINNCNSDNVLHSVAIGCLRMPNTCKLIGQKILRAHFASYVTLVLSSDEVPLKLYLSQIKSVTCSDDMLL
jgi:hypothetical protein